MRSILTKIAFTAALVLTFSCSSGDDDGGGSNNMSDLPKQVYLDGAAYNGNGDISIRIWTDDGQYSNSDGDRYDSVSAGKIQNGQISLDLPKSIDSKYFEKVEGESEDNEYCQSNISISPKNLTTYGAESFNVTIPGRSDCRIRLDIVSAGERVGQTVFLYSSAAGKMTGTETCTYYFYNSQTTYDVNFSKGWNLVTVSFDDNVITNISNVDTLQWHISCYDDDDYSKSLTKQLFTP